MKRTQAKVAGAPFFQFYKLSDYINDIDAAKYLLYGILTYQFITGLENAKTTKIIKRKSLSLNRQQYTLFV